MYGDNTNLPLQNKCAQELDSELDYAVYCFTTDGQHTVLTGYANYNTVCYFDRRFPRYAIKVRPQFHGLNGLLCIFSLYGSLHGFTERGR